MSVMPFCNANALLTRFQRLESGDPVLNEMQEQYNKLKDDYKDKIMEVSALRGDNEKLKKIVREAEYVKEDIMKRLEEREKELRCICAERNRVIIYNRVKHPLTVLIKKFL